MSADALPMLPSRMLVLHLRAMVNRRGAVAIIWISAVAVAAGVAMSCGLDRDVTIWCGRALLP